MIHVPPSGPPADMSGQILCQKIELVNVALGNWVRAGLSAGLVRDERRDKVGLVIGDGRPSMVPETWVDPTAVAYLEMEAALIAEIGSARTALLPLVMELFEIEELVILAPIGPEGQGDGRLSEPLLQCLRDMGFRSPRAVLGRCFCGAVSLRYARLPFKAAQALDAAAAADSLPPLRATDAELSIGRGLTTV